MQKIISPDALAGWSEQKKSAGKRIIATNGCFDLLHIGHLRYLKAARALGDCLVVGINSDASVRAIKGPTRPITLEIERAELLAGFEVVDGVSIFAEPTAIKFLEAVKPDIYVKGGDYKPEQLNSEEVEVIKKYGGKIEILPLVPGRSTTRIVNLLSQSSSQPNECHK
jgi:rfaE bifunctional protein nucleotidyltransferase chain/domain